MLFMQPAVVPHDGRVQDPVAEVRTVPKPVKTGVPTWKAESLVAQASSGPGGLGTGATPGAPVPEPPRANIAPGAGSTNNPFGSSTNPVGAQPVLPNQTSTNPTNTPGGNTYGTQQEGATPTTTPTAPTAPVSPGLPSPGAGTAGSGGTGLAAPPIGTPPAGNVDTGSSSFQNLSSPYNSTGGGAGTGTGMGTTAAPPSPGTSASPAIPAPTTSGASSTP
jgi:hypothetical protein